MQAALAPVSGPAGEMFQAGAQFGEVPNDAFQSAPPGARDFLSRYVAAGGQQFGPAVDMAQLLQESPLKDDRPSQVRLFEYATNVLGMDPKAASEWSKAGGTSVNVNMPQVGTIPQGQQLIYDEDGRPIRMENIPGGPAEAERMSTAQAQGRAAGFIMRDIGTLKSVIDEIPDNIYGRIVAGKLPHTQTFQAGILMDSVKATIAVDQLLEIKRQGSGLGQVPQQQLEYLAQLLGALNMNMPKERLKEHLDEIMDVYGRVLSRMSVDERALVGVAEKEFEKWKAGTSKSDEQEGSKAPTGGGQDLGDGFFLN
jgi:hypothetical protein